MGIIDDYMGKWASRKLFVFVIATIALFFNVIEPSDWIIISSVYIGTQGVLDILKTLKNN